MCDYGGSTLLSMGHRGILFKVLQSRCCVQVLLPPPTRPPTSHHHPSLLTPTQPPSTHPMFPSLPTPTPTIPSSSLPPSGLLAPLLVGATVVLPAAGHFSATSFWADCVAHKATFYTAVPTMHQASAHGGLIVRL